MKIPVVAALLILTPLAQEACLAQTISDCGVRVTLGMSASDLSAKLRKVKGEYADVCKGLAGFVDLPESEQLAVVPLLNVAVRIDKGKVSSVEETMVLADSLESVNAFRTLIELLEAAARDEKRTQDDLRALVLSPKPKMGEATDIAVMLGAFEQHRRPGIRGESLVFTLGKTQITIRVTEMRDVRTGQDFQKPFVSIGKTVLE